MTFHATIVRMIPGIDPDFGATADDYAAHRAGFPASFFERVAALGIGVAGQRLVDLGTGTGTLARGFARRGCRVIGIDPKEAMLERARTLGAQASPAEPSHIPAKPGSPSAPRGSLEPVTGGRTESMRLAGGSASDGPRPSGDATVSSIDYRRATAEETGLPDASADVVTAGQCWHWFDRTRAAREVARILDEDGRVVLAHFDWLPLRGNVVEATEALIEAHNPAWSMGGGTGLYPAWLRDLGDAAFRDITTFSYDEPVVYSPEGWRGRIRASAGVGASLPPERVAAFDAALAGLLSERYPGRALSIPHRVFVVMAAAPSKPR